MKNIRLFLIIVIFSLTGCTKNNEVHIETITINDNAYNIAISYPKCGYSTIDSKIEGEVNNIYEEFLSNKEIGLDKRELNIDYTFYQDKKYISVTLNTDKDIKCFNYSKHQDKMIDINDITSSDIYSTLTTTIFNEYGNILDMNLVKNNLDKPLFSFNKDNLFLYYQPNTISKVYNDIITVTIPREEVKEVSFIKERDEKVNQIIDTNKKVVALTFDDGPSRYTNEITQILKEEDAVATFFILGNKVELYQDTLKESILNGNEIGNHTFNHKWLTKLKDVEIKKQITDTQDIIKDKLNYTPVIFRPSYGDVNKRIREDIDLDIIMWNIDTMDWKYKSVDKIVSRATKNTEDSSIILMHETYERTVKALPKIIKKLKEENFDFVTISELKEINELRKQYN